MEHPDEIDAELKSIFLEALQEVADEERMQEVITYDKDQYNGLQGKETENDFYIEQDIQAILDDAKLERDARNDGLIMPEKGTRKFATVPMAAIIDYYNKFGIDILDAETSRDKWEMQKFRMWIQKTHPEFMVRDPGKTKYHTLK